MIIGTIMAVFMLVVARHYNVIICKYMGMSSYNVKKKIDIQCTMYIQSPVQLQMAHYARPHLDNR